VDQRSDHGRIIRRRDGEVMGSETMHMIAIRTIELSAKVRQRSGKLIR